MKDTEERIDKFVKKNYTEKELGQEYSTLNIQRKMCLINMKDPDEWEVFKLELREDGWLI